MILVKIEHREALLKDDSLTDFRDLIESTVGNIFEEELASIDVSVWDFGRFDTREEDVLITVEINEADIHHDLKTLTENFAYSVREHLKYVLGDNDRKFKVWVQRIAGQVAEIWTNK